MGLFSWIGSCISSVASCVKSVASAVWEGAKTVCSTVISAAKTVAQGISEVLVNTGKLFDAAVKMFKAVLPMAVKVFGPVLGPVAAVLIVLTVVAAITDLGKQKDVIDKDTTPEEVAAREEIAEERGDLKSRDEFESFKEYEKYLKENIPAEEVQARIRKSPLTYKIAGAVKILEEIGKKENMTIPWDLAVLAGQCHLNGKDLGAIVAAFTAKGFKEIDLRAFLKDELKNSRGLDEALVAELKKVYPEIGEADLWDKLTQMKKIVCGCTVDIEKEKAEITKKASENIQELYLPEIEKTTDSLKKNGKVFEEINNGKISNEEIYNDLIADILAGK